MSEDCSVCEDAALLQNASCNEKSFRWHVLKTLCYISEYLAAKLDLPTVVVGPADQGEAVSGAPVLGAGYAASTAPTAVEEGQVARDWNDLNGRRVVAGLGGDAERESGVALIAGATYGVLLSAPGVGKRLVILPGTISNVGIAANYAELQSPSGTRVNLSALPAGSTVPFGAIICPENEALGALSPVVANSTVYVNLTWYIADV
jgi:hypothetical protein